MIVDALVATNSSDDFMMVLRHWNWFCGDGWMVYRNCDAPDVTPLPISRITHLVGE